MPPTGVSDRQQPLPYHVAIRDYLKKEESEIWQRYASNRVRAEAEEQVRSDLLKSTYRLDRQSHGAIYDLAGTVAETLGLQASLTFYQVQNPTGLNASIAYLPDEAHIVFEGAVATRLSDGELRALVAHELGHLLLYRHGEGELLVAEQVLSALTRDRDADAAHVASARLFSLYTEIYCDRVALDVAGSLLEVVAMLVKIATDVDAVDAESYLAQAREVLGQGLVRTEGLSHPEAYLRAYVLDLWQARGPDANEKIAELIKGKPELETLDLTAQARIQQITRQLIDAMLAPTWLRTKLLLAHARMFFDDYALPEMPPDVGQLRAEVERGNLALRDYYAYVLLDFASADRQLEVAPLAWAIDLAANLGFQDRFVEIAATELRLRKSQIGKITEDRAEILAAAARMGDLR